MKKRILFLTLCFICLLFVTPLLIMFTSSFMGAGELSETYGGVLNNGDEGIRFALFPQYPTLRAYVELLLDSPGFFVMFWNSCKQVFPVLIGQLLVSVPAAWAFAQYEFKGKKILYFFYMILMIMPFQVTMVSTYLVLSKLHILNTHLAVILPGIFSAFPVFILTKFFKSIPKPLIEAAKIDGASDFQVFLKIGIPLGYPGILSVLILGFLEYWNAIEQPMTFLQEKELWPLSLYLPNIAVDKVSVSFVASVIMMIPAILIFIFGQRYLEEGIAASGLKE
ncbi:MAG: carbohydrate ABC transporter permease [Lachnospiraceae bacterium]|nr:carbohydrate ABC transporter permease [Lachnospiraceae bacterium]